MAMTATHPGTMSASMDVPQSQNTAPVIEFRCLYTADIRRKQKRWQDGRLKFHTFNKRVMVYDEKSNFVGDTHWKGGLDFDEGEELELERGGIMVEVAECIGKRDQDLTELVDKRVKDREERVAAKNVGASPSASRSWAQTPAGSAHLRQKPLNTMLTPSGHYGRALMPNTSPFEDKQRPSVNGGSHENEPPAKRRRQNETTSSNSGYAQNLMGATLTLASSKPSSTPTIRYEPFKAQPVARQRSAIDLTLDDENEDDVKARRRVAMENREALSKATVKQTKPKRAPPSKSGYASNLTGTPLMLSHSGNSAAARSNSTNRLHKAGQASREEHLASFSSSPAQNISFVQQARPQQQTARPVKRSKPTVMPPNSDDEATSSDIEMCPTIQKPPSIPIKALKNAERAMSPVVNPNLEDSSAAEEDSFIDIKPLPKRPSETLKSKSARPNLAQASKQRKTSLSKSSSPPPVSRSRSFNGVAAQKSSGMVPTPERSNSALRIKARPPRKMMMLMDRPNSNPAAGNERPKVREKPPDMTKRVSNEIIPSQATLQLDAFCAKQDAILQARLQGKLSKPKVDLDDMFSSCSEPDIGIDHQTIDMLLPRKIAPTEKPLKPNLHSAQALKAVARSRDETSKLAVHEKRHPAESSGSVTSDAPAQPQSLKNVAGSAAARKLEAAPPPYGNRPASTGDIPNVAVTVTPDKEARSGESATRLLDRMADSSDSVCTASSSPAFAMPTDDIPFQKETTVPVKQAVHTEARNVKPRSTKPTSTPATHIGDSTAQTDLVSPKGVSLSILNEREQRPTQEPAPQVIKVPPAIITQPNRKGTGLTPDFSNAVQAATEHFRAMVKLSTSATDREAGDSATRPETETPTATNSVLPPTHIINQPLPSTPVPPLIEIAAVRPSPELSPLIEAPVIEQPSTKVPDRPQTTGFSSANLLAPNPLLSKPPPLTTIKPAAAVTRAKLANPATRGKSLQTVAASTVDMMNPVFNNPMPPPAPRVSIRLAQTMAGERGKKTADGVVGEATVGGPWSREAWDLFGMSGPPGGGKATSV